jgi:hypothetical protein
MAYGRKTGGRQKGVPNKAKAELDALLAEASERATSDLTQEQIAAMLPLDVMLHAMRLGIANAQRRIAAALAEKAAPFIHPKLASETHCEFDRLLVMMPPGSAKSFYAKLFVACTVRRLPAGSPSGSAAETVKA